MHIFTAQLFRFTLLHDSERLRKYIWPIRFTIVRYEIGIDRGYKGISFTGHTQSIKCTVKYSIINIFFFFRIHP